MKTRALVMVAALALAGGACGDDDGDVSDDAAATSDSRNKEDSGGDDGDVSDDAAATSDSRNEDSGDDGSGGGEWCDLARDLESNTMFDDLDMDDPDSVESAYREVVEILDDAVDSAPDEIRADVQTVLTSTEELLEALDDVDFDFSALNEAVLGDLETLDASDRIEDYGEQVCGIASSREDSPDTVVDDSGG